MQEEKVTPEKLRKFLPSSLTQEGETILEATTLEELERIHIINTLKKCGGNKKLAAEILGISIKTLYNKLHHYQIGLNLEHLK